MMRRRRALAVLAGLTASAGTSLLAQSAPLLAQVRARLVEAPVLRGRFEQRKTVQGFRHPLLSRGEFALDKQRGMLWHTREPFESRLVLSRTQMRVARPDGRIDTRLDAAKDPAFREISAMLLAFLSADLDSLAGKFRIEGQAPEAPAPWHLQLTPRDVALAQWVARIDLRGDDYLRTIRLQEARGDLTQISLSGHAVAAALGQEEAALFE